MKSLEKLFSSLEGRVLCYGIMETSYLACIQKNEKITECFLLDSIDLERGGKGGKGRKISPKKFLKKFGKKSMDILVVREDVLGSLEKKLLPIFIKITKAKIYLYSVVHVEKTKKRYQRYKGVWKDKKEYVEIDLTWVKQNWLKDKFYYLEDCCIDLVDAISDFLIS